MTATEYGVRQDFPGIKRAAAFFGDLIDREGARSVLEIGAGANPTLSPDDGMRYVLNDVDEVELAKAGPGYATLLGDVSAPGWQAGEQFDFIFSRMVNEHVADGATYYGNIFRALRPGGLTVHCFSTLYAFPFVVNRLLPESVSHVVLDKTKPRDEEHHGKFKAYYSWSRGPTPRNIANFERLGFVVERYNGYFGHGYYGLRAPWLQSLERAKSRFLAKHPNPYLTAYAMVQLRRPAD
ncbi:MAG TPA: methyltransferase domain-containing protein [Acidimicrobiales bacterium]|nr:methyltransferase domain-containing protein [Acidimicrobiales bacterium]